MIRPIQPYNITYRSVEDVTKDEASLTITLPATPEAIEKKGEEKTGVNWASGVGIGVLTLICGSLMFSRGVQKNSARYLNKAKKYLEYKLELSSFNESKKKAKFYEYSIRRVNSFLRKSESINNITSLKDILFMRAMYKTQPTKKLHDAISDYFEKLSRKTVTNSYKKTEKSFKKMNSIFDELDEIILKKNPDKIIKYEGRDYTRRELVKEAKENRENALFVIDTFINQKGQDLRYKHMNDVTSSLYSNFWDVSFKDFWTKDNKFKRKEMWQTFIAAEQIKGNKTNIIKNINFVKEMIAYSDAYRENLTNYNLKELRTTIPVSDEKGIMLLDKFECLLKYRKNTDEYKEKLLNLLDKIENHQTNLNIDKQVSSAQEDYKKTCIEIIRNQINTNEAGYLQKMLSIYQEIAPYNLEKTGALNALEKSVGSLDESIRLEAVELFDKIRDLKLGSAPTDVLTIVISFIAISFGLGHAKDKDERNSIMLKSGIPIAGAIATAVISATKLVSGGKSIALGLLSGFILNKMGNMADKFLKTHNNKTQNAA